jgi:hypothetical protein
LIYSKHYYPSILTMLLLIQWLIKDTICCSNDASGIDGRFILIMLSLGIAALAVISQIAVWINSLLQWAFKR